MFLEQSSIFTLFEALLASSPVGFCFLDEGLRYVCVNESFAAMNGYAPAQLLGRTVREETPEFALVADMALQRVLLTGQPVFDLELKFAPSASRLETQYGLVSFYPILGSAGEIASIGATIVDITYRKVADIRLRESEERYRHLFDQSPYPVFVIRPDTRRFLAVNAAAIRSYGYSHEEFVSMDITTLRCDPNVPAFLTDYSSSAQACPEGQPDKEVERQHRKKDGGTVDVELSFSPTTFRGIYAHLILARDVTERKKSEEKLRVVSSELARSNSALEQFAATASHDLREPMRTITLFISLLKKRNQEKLDSESLGYMKLMTEGAARMAELIENLLDYSRAATIYRGESLVDLNKTLETTLLNLKIAIEESSAYIATDPLPEVMGDPIQLVQLFQNLLANAVKYRRKDRTPEIHIVVQKRESDFLFSVKDNGIGFEMEAATKIFEQFKRLHGRSDYSGSGLGLATCKRIVEQHGGRIWAESIAGKGAAFYFTIPRAPSTESKPR